MRVTDIFCNLATGEEYFKGILMFHTRHMEGKLPKKCNELCMILKARLDSLHDPSPKVCVVTRLASDVVAIREIVLTNRPFPELSFRVGGNIYTSSAEAEESAVLVCRWKSTEFYDPRDGKVKEESLARLRANETDRYCGMPDVQLRRQWRGEEGEKSPPPDDIKEDDPVDLTIDEDDTGKHMGKNKSTRSYDVDLTQDDIDLTQDEDDDVVEEVVKTETTETYKRINRDGVTERKTSKTSTVKTRFTPTQTSLKSMFGIKKAGSSRGSTPWNNTKSKVKAPVQYIAGDICSGAGGTASGLLQAGLKLDFVLDHWPEAIETLRKNFAAVGTRILYHDIYDLCTGKVKFIRYYRVDILHISFPCQPHSLVHTIDGKNDEANIAAGYSAIPILQLLRPRIVTLEQTPGIIHRGGFHFRALIHQLTSLGYSVRWKILNAADYGNVQARKRLIIIASWYVILSLHAEASRRLANCFCSPGELLPPLPAPTHGTSPNLKPFTTIFDVLALVPRWVDQHMQNHTTKAGGTPYSPHQSLRSCITTNGGESDLHPNGKRSFNLQELALCQGFLPGHRFAPGGLGTIRKQIGNAVPSCMAKAIFDEVVRTLRKSDEATAALTGRSLMWIERVGPEARMTKGLDGRGRCSW